MCATTSLTKVAEIAKITNFTQLALSVASKAILPENAGITQLDHLILMLSTPIKNTGDARHSL